MISIRELSSQRDKRNNMHLDYCIPYLSLFLLLLALLLEKNVKNGEVYSLGIQLSYQ